ncbi:MAG: molybdopterin-dependent oxidoreductase [Steroidobacteraceae bacterium]|jgi:anaerobic selenocysteine-containing dehydrogenase
MSRLSADEVLITTCPRDCYDSCGIRVVKRGGAVIAVRGDPNHPVSRGTLCGKCSTAYNREWRDPERRLTRPLRRVRPKAGEGGARFEPVSWETAIAEIAARLNRIVASHGPQSILNAHYTGTISLLAGLAPMRFFNRLGATEVTPDTICNMAGHVALRYMYGTSLDGFDPRTAAQAKCIVVWGANPHASAPHAHEHWLPEAPGKVIVVDPVRTPTAAEADVHLQPFPGSDAALAFALLHVIQRDGLLDEAFIRARVKGWDELASQVAALDLAEQSAVTGVPAARIEQAAHLYAPGPSLLWLGQGLQRQLTGGNVMRACALLPALTGNLGKPGAGLLYLNGNLGQRRIDEAYLSGAHLASAPPPAVSHMDLVEALEDARRSQALIVWNMNPLASCPRQAQLRSALEREDLFTVALDLFPTDTTELADYVLPAASFLEFDDLIAPYFHLALSAQVKAMPPLGEALPNLEIFRRLARAMGFTDPEFRESDREILERLLAASALGEDFESLKQKGTIFVPKEPAVQFADGVFLTPSARIEVASDAAMADGQPRLPQCRSDPRPAAGHLRLLSPAHAWLLNTSFGNVDKIRTRLGSASIALNPADAAERRLREGEIALVRNGCGRLNLKVAMSDELPRGVALAHKGRWLDSDPGHANVNVLNPGVKSDMGQSTAVHSVEVTVTPADS